MAKKCEYRLIVGTTRKERGNKQFDITPKINNLAKKGFKVVGFQAFHVGGALNTLNVLMEKCK